MDWSEWLECETAEGSSNAGEAPEGCSFCVTIPWSGIPIDTSALDDPSRPSLWFSPPHGLPSGLFVSGFFHRFLCRALISGQT